MSGQLMVLGRRGRVVGEIIVASWLVTGMPWPLLAKFSQMSAKYHIRFIHREICRNQQSVENDCKD
uniref:Uncharacterized protein n=1 Tax=Arundo donax TaxID=35708 RepID=A0A0A9CF14_ARUDO